MCVCVCVCVCVNSILQDTRNLKKLEVLPLKGYAPVLEKNNGKFKKFFFKRMSIIRIDQTFNFHICFNSSRAM
jgi:hypothetical protein